MIMSVHLKTFLRYLMQKLSFNKIWISLLRKSICFTPITSDSFTIPENPYNLRNFQILYFSNKRTVKFEIEAITCRSRQLWNLLPNCLTTSPSFEIIKREIKKWKGETCPCRISKTYIQ